MKDIYKNPTLYYILVPAIIAMWPLLIWGVYLPGANNSLNKELKDYKDAGVLMEEILRLDPDRLALIDVKLDTEEFDYARAVQQVATVCGIPSANYKLSSGIIITTSGKRSQSANVALKEVGMEKFARFLSTIQLRWENLQCDRVKLTKKKGLPDAWDADLVFKYFY